MSNSAGDSCFDLALRNCELVVVRPEMTAADGTLKSNTKQPLSENDKLSDVYHFATNTENNLVLFYMLFLQTGAHSPLQSKEPKRSQIKLARARTHIYSQYDSFKMRFKDDDGGWEMGCE